MGKKRSGSEYERGREDGRSGTTGGNFTEDIVRGLIGGDNKHGA